MGRTLSEPPQRTRTADAPNPSPRTLADGNRFLRGTLTHALLQHLPTRPRVDWASAASGYVAARAAGLSARAQASIVAETLAILADPAFGHVFGPDSRAEVPIVAEIAAPDGDGHTIRLAGQIDRLVVRDTEVLIVDFKTNRPPPTDATQVADTYVLQLAAYRLAVARIFPGLPVRAALLWTDGPHLMELPGDRLDAAASRLFKLGR